MTLEPAAHLAETIVSLGILGLLWKVNRFLNKIWDAMNAAPPHAHFGKRIWYPPPFKAPQVGMMDMQNGGTEPHS